MPEQPTQITVTVAEVVAWLTKKAGEYRATRGRQHAVVADAMTTLASKVHRGAVRPNNVLGADLTTLDPIQLRWGLDNVMWGDDDTVTVLMSGPAGEPYWLELDPDRAVVLRGALAGPGGEQAAPADRDEVRDRIAKALEREDAINAGYDHGFASSYGADAETDGFVNAVLAVLPAPADRAAVYRHLADQQTQTAVADDLARRRDMAAARRQLVKELRRMADEAQPDDRPRLVGSWVRENDWSEPTKGPMAESAPADRAELRDRIAEAARTVPIRLGPNAAAMAQRNETCLLNFTEAHALADAVLAVLPADTGQTAVLREAADALNARAEELVMAAKNDWLAGMKGITDARYRSAECWRGAADEVRRMADEAQDGAS